MKKTVILMAVGCVVLGSICLSACATTVAPAGAPEAAQTEGEGASDGKVSLTSSETVKVVPDMAQIVYAVSTEHEDAATCQQDNAAQLEALLTYLRSAGVADSSIQTSGYYLDTLYDWSGDARRVVGYEMRTQVTVTDVPIDQVGAMLTGAAASGANEIQSVSYFASGYDEAYNQALAAAVALSRSKAEALAAAEGKTVGQVLAMTEYGDNQYGRYVESGIMRSMNTLAATEELAMDMGVMPGEMEVTAAVTVEYELLSE